MMRKLFSLMALPFAVACSAPSVTRYAAEQPKLDLVAYFAGTVDAWGMFQKRNGEVVKRFTVQITGRRDGDRFILDERFRYSDGNTDRRVWTLTQDADGRWRGTAGDVVGQARGELAGNALNWRYTLKLPVDGKVYEVQLDDWMFLVDEHTLINRASMSKFGFDVGEVTLFFRKRQP
ncbi:DUF3833 domain-containing protein [Chitiniphilus purpureus]|uniref:DUF3833 domain-containing protein n=1 Tax=Chitiniphilus purpureus TaxID=2981137 RepID=A0ABY6DN77_9NEIS|nr:DUF3833 domain-containing protein [Chitiniphilus sp. CD1]UXY15834.1 DUF3833 domain-containing protein [Chitiniphilus sp. CD1]